jgi:hypothetical protein
METFSRFTHLFRSPRRIDAFLCPTAKLLCIVAADVRGSSKIASDSGFAVCTDAYPPASAVSATFVTLRVAEPQRMVD